LEAQKGNEEDTIKMATQTATKPEGPTGEFKGDIRVDDTLPDKKMLAKADGLTILDEDKKQHTFKSLYAGKGRIMIVFIRHFFCGVRLLFSAGCTMSHMLNRILLIQ